MTDIDFEAYLRKPQLHNSYSYAGNNPVKYVDKNGEFVFLAIPLIYLAVEVGFTAYDVYDVVKTLSDANSSNLEKGVSIVGAGAGIILPGGGYSGADDAAKLIAKNGLRASDASRAAENIAGGHAFEKHVLERGEFVGLEIRTRDQFKEHITGVLENPTRSGDLKNGRSYAYDGDTNTLVIRNPNTTDGGTAFRPERGEKYVDELE